MAQNGRSRDAWRGAAGSAPKPARGPAPRGSARRWVVAAFVVSALAGAIAGLFFYLRPDPEPVVLVLPITQYKHADWLANPLADSDAKGFFEAFPGLTAPAFPDQEKARVLGAVQRVVDESRSTSKSRPIVVYLNALGIARNGTPYILPGDADPADESTWLPLKEVLAALRKGAVPRLLILDLRPVGSIRSAVATSDLNVAIKSKLDARAAPDENLWILTANNPVEGPTLVRPVRQSAFGLALAQGIGGRADGWNPEKHTNGRVSFQEFAQYARQVTLIATRSAGGGDQLPTLFGPAGDFPLVSIPIAGPKALPEKVESEAYPDWLKAAWTERDRWTAEGVPRRAPRLLIHQGLVASRAEDAWYAGADPTANRDRHEPALKKLAEAAKLFPPLSLPNKSHARWSAGPDAAVQEASATVVLRPYLMKIVSEEPLKKEDWQPALQTVKVALEAKPSETPPEAVQGAILTALLGLKSPSREQIDRAAAMLSTLPAANRLAEIIPILWIAGLPPEQTREWEKAAPGTIYSLLLLAKSTEQAAALDGRSFPWLRGELERLDAARRAALVSLGSPDSGIADFRAAKETVDSTRRDYDRVRDAGGRLAASFGEIEEGRAVLADLAAAYPHKLAPAPAAVATRWAGLVEHYRKSRLLSQPTGKSGFPKLDELAGATRSLDVHRTDLMALRIGAEDADPKRLEAALRWPWLNGAEREKLRVRHEEASQALAKRVLDRWPATPQPEATSNAPADAVRDDAFRDLRIAVDRLTLAEAGGSEKLLRDAKALDRSDEAGISSLGDTVRQSERKALVVQYKAAELPARAAMGWAIHPDDLPAVPVDAGTANPEPAYRKQREIEFARWLGRRYALEADDLRAVKDKACRDAAEELDAVAGAYRNWNP